MPNASIDPNTRNSLPAYNDTTGQIEEVRVDPVLNAVLVYGVADTGGAFTSVNRAKIDGNSRNVLAAWNEDTRQIESLRCSNNNELLVLPI